MTNFNLIQMKDIAKTWTESPLKKLTSMLVGIRIDVSGYLLFFTLFSTLLRKLLSDWFDTMVLSVYFTIWYPAILLNTPIKITNTTQRLFSIRGFLSLSFLPLSMILIKFFLLLMRSFHCWIKMCVCQSFLFCTVRSEYTG